MREDQQSSRSISGDLRFRVARAIWDAMVNDEVPDDNDLLNEGYVDAADAAIRVVLDEVRNA